MRVLIECLRWSDLARLVAVSVTLYCIGNFS
jgi:hypothetical protein